MAQLAIASIAADCWCPIMAEPRKVRPKGAGAAVCLFSKPGIGKTSFVTGAPNTCLIRSPVDHIPKYAEKANKGNYDEIVVNNWAELSWSDESCFRWIQQGAWKKYDWFWLDSLSLFMEVGLRDLYDAAVDRKPARAEFGLDKGEYGINQFRVSTFVMDMVGLVNEGKLNFGIVCHTMEWMDPDQGKTLWAPNILGREGLFMQKIMGMMHSVLYLYIHEAQGKKPVRVLRRLPEGRDVFVKDQLDISTKGRIVNPSMDDLNKVAKLKKRTNTSRRTTRRTTRRKSK